MKRKIIEIIEMHHRNDNMDVFRGMSLLEGTFRNVKFRIIKEGDFYNGMIGKYNVSDWHANLFTTNLENVFNFIINMTLHFRERKIL